MSDLYFCFDVYTDNEQEEAGDTLTHTFIKEPWPYCQERWFYFHGEINGIPSPSTSCIFYKHPIASLLPTHKYDLLGGGRLTEAYWGTYEETWAWANASVVYNNIRFTQAGAWGFERGPFILRGYLVFDTTALPPGKEIYSAHIRFHRGFVQNDGAPFDLVLQNGQPDYPHVPCVLSDYNKAYYHGNGGSIPDSEFNSDVPFNLKLNAQGLSWIRAGEYTKLCLRTSFDIAGVNPWTAPGVQYHRARAQYFYDDAWHFPELWLGYD